VPWDLGNKVRSVFEIRATRTLGGKTAKREARKDSGERKNVGNWEPRQACEKNYPKTRTKERKTTTTLKHEEVGEKSIIKKTEQNTS